MMKRALVGLLLLAAVPAYAHRPSDSTVRLWVDGARIEGRWDIALRDLDAAVGLDDDGDEKVTGRELRAHAAAIAAYALPRLAVTADGDVCPLRTKNQGFIRHSDGGYVVLELAADCPHAPRSLAVEYQLLFDLDPQHRGLVSVNAGSEVETAILRADAPRVEVVIAHGSMAAELAGFVGEGVRHIWAGADHILFLLALLLPAVLGRRGSEWIPNDGLGSVATEVLKVVTGFTVAHSLTLALAGLGLVRLPARFVETAIAVTVVLAALNNLRPVAHARWPVAFCLGLLHGFGFSNVLGDLGVGGTRLVAALLGFNVGVEVGQAAIVAAFLPLAYALRRTWLYRRAVLGLGSLTIAGVATYWAIDRFLS
jgi:HupE / UreJ protein